MTEQIEYRGFYINVKQDFDAETPRDWDNVGTMVCFHNQYNLGDDHSYSSTDYNGWDELKAALVREHNPAVILPLYLYDHSGLTMRTFPFSPVGFKAGVGFIFVSKAKAVKEFGKKYCSKEVINRARNYLLGEVETYDQYLRGDVYGFTIEPKDCNKSITCDESYWGFYGDPHESGLIQEAKGAIDYAIREYKQNVIEAKLVKASEKPPLKNYTVVGFWGDSFCRYVGHIKGTSGDNAEELMQKRKGDNLHIVAVLHGTPSAMDTATYVSGY